MQPDPSAPRPMRTRRFARLRLDTWGGVRSATASWNWRVWFWRCQVQLTVHRHGPVVGALTERWVIQPHFVYDRKREEHYACRVS